MKKMRNGGLETIIAIVIVTGLVVALIVGVIFKMSEQGDRLIGETTNQLVNQQKLIGPS